MSVSSAQASRRPIALVPTAVGPTNTTRGLNAKTDSITEKVFGTLDQQSQATVARGKLRTLLGSEYIRELNLK